MQVNIVTEERLASLLKPLDEKLEAISSKLNAIDAMGGDETIITAKQAQDILGIKSFNTLKSHVERGLKVYGVHSLGQTYRFQLAEVKRYKRQLLGE